MSAPRKIKVVGGYDHHNASSPSAGQHASTPTGRRLGASVVGRSPTVAGSLKAKVDLHGWEAGTRSGVGAAGPSTPPTTVATGAASVRVKATPDGLRTVKARAGPSPPNGVANGTPKARLPFGGESVVPLSSGSAPVTPVASRAINRSAAPSPSLPHSAATARPARDLGSPALPATVRPSRPALANDATPVGTPRSRRGSLSGGSALTALSTSETPPSRARVSTLLPSPSIPGKNGTMSPPRSPVPSNRASRPTSPMAASSSRPSSPATFSAGGVKLPRSPAHRSSASSTLSSSSSASNWAQRNSISRSSRSSDCDLGPPGSIVGRLEKAESQQGWAETEAERLIRMEREAAELELKEREGEAKVNRKILDLEIQNASLLAINSSLERTKLKQASEIRDLRRRLRDKSLAPLSSTSPGLLSPSSDCGAASFFSGSDSEDGQSEVDFDALMKEDPRFGDVARLLDSLIRRAADAVAFQPSEKDPTSKRVLNTVEMEAKRARDEARGLGLEMAGLRPPRDSLASSIGMTDASDTSSRAESPGL